MDDWENNPLKKLQDIVGLGRSKNFNHILSDIEKWNSVW